MNIYESEYIHIKKQGDTLVQQWTSRALGIDDFQREMSTFIDLFIRTKPKSLLWDNKNCNLTLPKELSNWMEKEILIPIYQKGVRKMAFTIPDDIAVHLSIINSLEKGQSLFQSSFFSTENEANYFLVEGTKNRTSDKLPELDYQLSKNQTSFGLNLNIEANDLPKVLTYLKQIEADKLFIEMHKENYESLTLRELEIFRLIATGHTNKQIANTLFIEESSVKTHRKHIKKKLAIKSHFDIYQYARCFSIIV